MPELPEVETIRRGLQNKIIGKKITDIDILNPKSFQGETKDIVDNKIIDIERRAKLIRIKLSNGLNLLFHLKLTGQLIYQTIQKLTTTRLIFTFDDQSKLFFNDLRKFGWCKVMTDNDIDKLYKKDYGLEPLDEKFDVNYLLTHAKRIPNRNIKQFLMDQTIAAGMGNIYTDEALFEAKISPLRKVKDIKMSEWQTLISSMQKVLSMGIRFGGTTDSDYVNADGKKGGMQDHLNVYHKTGKPCPGSCGGRIERITIGGRGTHFCPNCQK